MQGVPTKTLKMQENANKTLKMREKWHQTFKDARVCCEDFEDVETCHQEFWHCTIMPIEERWCNIDFGYIIYHHSGGSWRRLDFRDMMWNDTTQKGDDVVQISELWCSLDLQGTRRCLQEISDAKHISEMWENIHRRWAMPWRLRFLQKKLEISFYSTTMHQVMFVIISMSTPYSLHFLLQRPLIITLRSWLSLSNALSTEGTLKAYWWPLENSLS